MRLRGVTEVVWTPSAEVLERSNVVRLMRRHGIEDYRELARRSIDERD
jgi:RNA 3'-terminal phosphate cyclase